MRRRAAVGTLLAVLTLPACGPAGNGGVVVEDLQRARTGTEQAGWTPQAARQQLMSAIENDRHAKAVGDITGYADGHCGGG